MHTPSCVCPDSRVAHRSGSATVRRLRTNPDVCITRKRTKNKISGLKYIQYNVQCTECGGSQEMPLSGSEKHNIIHNSEVHNITHNNPSHTSIGAESPLQSGEAAHHHEAHHHPGAEVHDRVADPLCPGAECCIEGVREFSNQHCSGEAAIQMSGEDYDQHHEGGPDTVCSGGGGAQQHGLVQPEGKEVIQSCFNSKPDLSSWRSQK